MGDKEDIINSDKLVTRIMCTLKAENNLNPNYRSDFGKLDQLLLYSDLCAKSLWQLDSAISKDNYSNF
jgi:hypothetical protein